MKKTLLAVTSFLFFILFYSNVFSQVPADFEALFNGEDLTGWVLKGKPEDTVKNYWSVDDEAIIVNSIGDKDHDYVWLVSMGEFDNFELQIKFAVYKSSPGNSGIQLRSRYDDEAFWMDGPQIDIAPAEPWRTGFIWDETRGESRWIYPDLPAEQEVDESMQKKSVPLIYSDDEEKWNQLEVYADGNKIQAWLNGDKITDFKAKKILDNEVHRDHDVGKKGHICLQLHTGDELMMKYKDIFIKEL